MLPLFFFFFCGQLMANPDRYVRAFASLLFFSFFEAATDTVCTVYVQIAVTARKGGEGRREKGKDVGGWRGAQGPLLADGQRGMAGAPALSAASFTGGPRVATVRGAGARPPVAAA